MKKLGSGETMIAFSCAGARACKPGKRAGSLEV
jgi:hypothetical protein